MCLRCKQEVQALLPSTREQCSMAALLGCLHCCSCANVQVKEKNKKNKKKRSRNVVDRNIALRYYIYYLLQLM
jgi:hypothetical protein